MDFEGLKYLVKYPKDFKENLKYPTVIFLHGSGSRGQDFEKLVGNPFFKVENALQEKAIVYAPLCSEDTWFDVFEKLCRFAKYVTKRKTTDCERLYLIGASMGGYATWQMAMTGPELYAGIIPICGGGMYWNAARLKGISIWAFHGQDDQTVYCEESVKMVERINSCGGEAKLTLFENCGHNSWDKVYSDNSVMEWLLSCRRKKQAASKSEYDSPLEFG